MNLTWTESSQQQTCYTNHSVTPSFSIVRTRRCWLSNGVDHGLRDAKGRAIGNYAVIYAYQKLRRDESGKLVEPVGLVDEMTFEVSTQATRDGHTFGSSFPRGTECGSLEEAKALAEKKIAAAGRRFARAVEKGTARQFRRPS